MPPLDKYTDYFCDPIRKNLNTGIFVRAKMGETWGSYDMSRLTDDSLIKWLRSRPHHNGNNVWCELVVFMLLGRSGNPLPHADPVPDAE